MRETLRKEGHYFSNGRSQKFRDEILTYEEKKLKVISELKSRAEYYEELTDIESEFKDENSDKDEDFDEDLYSQFVSIIDITLVGQE